VSSDDVDMILLSNIKVSKEYPYFLVFAFFYRAVYIFYRFQWC